MSIQDFEIYLKEKLTPALIVLEKARRKKLCWVFWSSVIFILFCYIIAINIKLDGKTLGPIIFTAILPYLLITEKYKISIQKKVMNIFTQYFDNLTFVEGECIPDFKLAKSKLFNFSKNYSQACFCGEENKQKTTIALTKLWIYDEQTNKREITFDGIVAVSLTEKFYPNQIIITNNAQTETFADLPRIKDTNLCVFSDNENVAKSILTDEFTKWFLSIKETFQSEKYIVTIFENTILCAIYKEKIKPFEYKSIFQKIYFCKKMEQMYKFISKLLEVNYFQFPTAQIDDNQ